MNLARSIVKNQSCNCRKIYSMYRRCVHDEQGTPSSDGMNKKEKNIENSCSIDDMSEPTNCCMSGCANCVWIQYAEKLSDTLEKSDANLQKLIIEKVQDPNMKAFLKMELRWRNLIK
ncbi:PREDICTED: oxidoreductase-like domain-containing protein 1 [Dufourea novaeangliae]|uniref:Uncharacterized protein C17orf90 like protein n=1 Tax=Dufourea novaeangliae TaxID=178035 RepID=A0A154P1H6_DUFNO|nr:PREDICTED: oxidoreductase-like domain-containing protein 1 [Dufourea novaeangliae]KZC05711.1 Uncharacterized protein C17orf90 like protein [Dufourea novaeangliae]